MTATTRMCPARVLAQIGLQTIRPLVPAAAGSQGSCELWRSSSPATNLHLTLDPKGAEAVTIKRRLVKLERANPPIEVRGALVITGAQGEVLAVDVWPYPRQVGEKAR
jgi:hypothetical protein